ncbi:multicopper oxidase, partial [Rhizophagus diaphanus]
LTLKKIKMSPNGFERTVWSVNGQHPGPLIQANKGDRLTDIDIYSLLFLAVHWHGMFQHGTVKPVLTQCPIPKDVSLVHNFSTTDQYGTYWYH